MNDQKRVSTIVAEHRLVELLLYFERLPYTLAD